MSFDTNCSSRVHDDVSGIEQSGWFEEVRDRAPSPICREDRISKRCLMQPCLDLDTAARVRSPIIAYDCSAQGGSGYAYPEIGTFGRFTAPVESMGYALCVRYDRISLLRHLGYALPPRDAPLQNAR